MSAAVRAVRTVAASAVVAACSVGTGPSEPRLSPRLAPTVRCDAAIEAAVAFFADHPEGPAGLDAGEAERLSGLVGEVEVRCPPRLIATFGSEHLELWSASGPMDGPPVTTSAIPDR